MSDRNAILDEALAALRELRAKANALITDDNDRAYYVSHGVADAIETIGALKAAGASEGRQPEPSPASTPAKPKKKWKPCRGCGGKGHYLDTTYTRAGGDDVECLKCFGTGKGQDEIEAIVKAAATSPFPHPRRGWPTNDKRC